MAKDTAIEKAKLEALEQENKILKEALAKSVEKEQAVNALSPSIEDEVRRIRKKGKSQANVIQVIETLDHVRVSLWTKWGKHIGPLHPDNAIQTLHRFADVGIILSTEKPTTEQVAEWYNSAEGKRFVDKENKRRALKDKTRKSGQMDRLTAEIARMTGTVLENRILAKDEIKK